MLAVTVIEPVLKVVRPRSDRRYREQVRLEHWRDSISRHLRQELFGLVPRWEVGDIRLRRHVFEVRRRLKPHELQVENVDRLGQVGLARVTVHQGRQRDRVVDPVVDFTPGEQLGVGGRGKKLGLLK